MQDPGRAYIENFVAERPRKAMQLISCEGPLTGTAVIFPIPSLRTCRMLPINKMRFVTHLRSPVRATVGPQTSALTIQRRVLIHAVIHADIWKTLYTWPRLQQTRIRIFYEPAARLQLFNDVSACLYQAIAALKIAWTSCCSGPAVHSAVGGCPHNVKVARPICSSIIPCRNICLYLCAISTVPVYICDLPPCLSKRFAHRSCARAEEQSTRHCFLDRAR